MSNENSICQICGANEKLTLHHLIPQLKCKNKYKKLKNDESNHIMVCETCHSTIHAYFDETQLRDLYPTLERLLSNERFAKYVAWRKKHIGKDVCNAKMSNDRKHR